MRRKLRLNNILRSIFHNSKKHSRKARSHTHAHTHTYTQSSKPKIQKHHEMVTWRFRCRLPRRRTLTRGPVDQPGEQPGPAEASQAPGRAARGPEAAVSLRLPQPQSGPEETRTQGCARLAQLGDPPDTRTLTSVSRSVTESPEGQASCQGLLSSGPGGT